MGLSISITIMRPLLTLITCAAPILSAAAQPPVSSAPTLDQDKLRLLSCDTSAGGAGRQRAVQWLNGTAETLPRDAGQRLAGPVRLGKACLANVTVAGGFGVTMIQGEICNDSLGEFTEALAAAGTPLGKDVDTKMPGAVLAMASGQRRYMVTKGMIDMRTGKTIPTSAPYAFTCTAQAGGAQ